MPSTEQTFTSTRCIGNATARMTSSVMSVETFDAFLGQLIQIIPEGSSSGSNFVSSASRSAHLVTKICAALIGARGLLRWSRTSPSAAISSCTLSGMPSHHTRIPSLSDSFFASGVPEYPLVSSKLRRQLATHELWKEALVRRAKLLQGDRLRAAAVDE